MRAAVLGSPIEHSLSPVLHTAAYAELGLAGEWSYERFECDEAGLPAFLARCDRTWAGLSLTMPLKRVALELADEVDELAVQVGGANTLVFTAGRVHAWNTDVAGIMAALREAGIDRVRSAAVLGGGATAASAVAALRGLGALDPGAVTVLARDPARAAGVEAAAGRMGLAIGVRPLAEIERHLDVDLVVSTLPAGAADLLVPAVAASRAALFDVVYSPWPTELARAVHAAGAGAGQRSGRIAVGGFPMLLHQAAVQVELMTGAERAPVEAMRAAGEAELRRRA
ncbi:shikimate dehydrogenase [Nocardiopsis mwathae]|uniref:Shikimate dehydrogenase n=1 Tax=Nocardiopsis mwathae TaxID=1472723 RepID=A0A7X0D4A4_9ACTN|nr:shikimate dehydrogenase [Nocardiopsis mwathae]MBB6171063.1 shikimate dehydrogenase [Nocardiopsis mwathae]